MKWFIFCSFIFINVAAKRTFEGYKVYKISPKNVNELNFVKDLERDGIGQLWDDQVNVDFEARIMVKPDNVENFLNKMDSSGVGYKVMIGDLQRVINEQMQPNQIRSSSYLSYSWDRYHDLDTIYKWLDEIVEQYPNIVTSVVMGQSVEGRDIKGIVINYKPEKEHKTIGMIEGTLHAREWISPAVVNWIVKEFLTSDDPGVRIMAENIEWHIFPVVNPDGYVYTFTTNRMWRKNRSTYNFQSCSAFGLDDDMSNGIDLNRNFNFHWMSTGASDNPCTNTYAGPSAFSEPEARAIANYVLGLKDQGRFIYYYGFHSYTQLFVIPYSHVNISGVLEADNYSDMYEIAVRGAEKAKERYNTTYRVGIAAEILYPMSGTSFDWVKHEANVAVSYLIELRDLGEYGFLLPPAQIIPNSLEIMDALIEMDRVTRLLGYYSKSTLILGSFNALVLSIVLAILIR
ncbi:zinc carboxypeptidase-like [Leptidea sinapis]|uniref:zinc carboxypeptidase-like n=1 Tax=Leptidea sinapis TaxID=189913 RepID=UPI00213879C4|nr:zinc carboxypeptidase-like [Leptidea sinapis]